MLNTHSVRRWCTLLLVWSCCYNAETSLLWGNTEPFWKNACGGMMTVSSPHNLEDLQDTHLRSLRKIRQQLKMTQLQIIHYDIDTLLIDAQRGVERKDYIPNWIPDISAVSLVLEIGVQSLDKYSDQLFGLHINLQKFAIAFEQVWIDEHEAAKKNAMTNLIEYLRELLCEVESTILALGEKPPEIIPRSLMTPNERAQLDYTNRIIRDNGILLKYKEFINGWITVYKRARRRDDVQRNIDDDY